MPINIDKNGLISGFIESSSNVDLHNLLTLENVSSISGVARVMVRTHLNRSGINYVTRGFKKKTLCNRVLGVFPVGFDVNNFDCWSKLVHEFLNYAERSIDNNTPDELGNPLFNASEIDSFKRMTYYNDSNYHMVKNDPQIHNNWARLMRGLFTGFKFLESFCQFDSEIFKQLVNSSTANAKAVNNLLKQTSKSIDEYGQTLAGSFYADYGAEQFIKDDIHVIDSVSAFTGLSKSSIKGEYTLQLLHNTAAEYDVTPRSIGKLMYLAGSSNLYLFDFRLDRARQVIEKKKFLDFLNRSRLKKHC